MAVSDIEIKEKTAQKQSQTQEALFPIRLRLCQCGCGLSLEGRRKNVKYFNAQHRSKAARDRKLQKKKYRDQLLINSIPKLKQKYPNFFELIKMEFWNFYFQFNRYPTFNYCWYIVVESNGYRINKNLMKRISNIIRFQVPKAKEVWQTRERRK